MIRKRPYGFTLVELVVVIALITVFLAFSLPIFKSAGIFSRQAIETDDLARVITLAKHRAIQENRDFFLHLDINKPRAWLTHSDMDEQALEKPGPKQLNFRAICISRISCLPINPDMGEPIRAKPDQSGSSVSVGTDIQMQ